MAIVLNKGKKETLIKNMFWELRGTYKGMVREVNNLNNIFDPNYDGFEAIDDIEGLGAYLQRIQMYQRDFDIIFEKIKLLFKIIFNVDEHNFIMEDSVIKYCRGQIDYIEYFIMKGDKQIFKKFKA